MSSTVRWGILSTADIGAEKVIPGIAKAARCEVVAIASRDGERPARSRIELGIPNGHGSYEALLADPDVDAVYIPLPNHLHAEWTIAAPRAGKHVLCEKPLAMTAPTRSGWSTPRDAERRPADGGVHVPPPSVVGRGDGARRSPGGIGRLRAVQSWFSYYNDDPANIRNILDVGGGALFDIGCYAVNLSRMVFDGEPTGVQASLRARPGDRHRHADQRDPRFRRGHRRRSPARRGVETDQRVHIYGTTGRHLDRDPVQHPARPPDPRVRDGRRRPAGGAGDRDRSSSRPPTRTRSRPSASPPPILDGTPTPVPPEDAVANLRVIEAIFAVAERGPAGAPLTPA